MRLLKTLIAWGKLVLTASSFSIALKLPAKLLCPQSGTLHWQHRLEHAHGLALSLVKGNNEELDFWKFKLRHQHCIFKRLEHVCYILEGLEGQKGVLCCALPDVDSDELLTAGLQTMCRLQELKHAVLHHLCTEEQSCPGAGLHPSADCMCSVCKFICANAQLIHLAHPPILFHICQHQYKWLWINAHFSRNVKQVNRKASKQHR